MEIKNYLGAVHPGQVTAAYRATRPAHPGRPCARDYVAPVTRPLAVQHDTILKRDAHGVMHPHIMTRPRA